MIDDRYYLRHLKYADWMRRETYKNPGACGTHGVCINLTEGDPGLAHCGFSEKAGIACFDTGFKLWRYGIPEEKPECFMCVLELTEYAFNVFAHVMSCEVAIS